MLDAAPHGYLQVSVHLLSTPQLAARSDVRRALCLGRDEWALDWKGG
jgi:hypothetical protein